MSNETEYRSSYIKKIYKQISNQSERYLKTDVAYLTKNGFWLLLGQGSVFLLSFLLVWGFANLLDPETYGQYRFLITVVSILGLTALPGTSITLVRAVSRGNSGTLKSLIRERFRWSILGFIVGLIGAAYYFIQDNYQLAVLFGIIAIFVPLTEPFSIHTPYLNGFKDFKAQAKLNIVQRSTIVGSMLLALILTDNIFILIITFLVSTAVIYHVLAKYVQHIYPPNKNVDEETIPYTRHISLQSALKIGTGYIDKVVLWYLAGPVSVAAYTIAVALPQELQSAFSQIGTLALPKMSSRSRTELQQTLLRKFFIFIIATTPIAFLYFITAPYIFSILFPQYIDAVLYSQLASLIILATPMILITQYFYATKKTTELYTIQTIEPIVFIAALMIMVPILGTLGAVIAMLVRVYTSLLLHIFFFLRDRRIAS